LACSQILVFFLFGLQSDFGIFLFGLQSDFGIFFIWLAGRFWYFFLFGLRLISNEIIFVMAPGKYQ
jgi:hypothetical protein